MTDRSLKTFISRRIGIFNLIWLIALFNFYTFPAINSLELTEDNSNTEGAARSLSRKKRYLIFPQGSNVQVMKLLCNRFMDNEKWKTFSDKEIFKKFFLLNSRKNFSEISLCNSLFHSSYLSRRKVFLTILIKFNRFIIIIKSQIFNQNKYFLFIFINIFFRSIFSTFFSSENTLSL